MNDEEKPKKKILVLGDYGVGKTSLIKQCVNEDFDDQYLTTLGVNIALKDIFPYSHPQAESIFKNMCFKTSYLFLFITVIIVII